MILLLLVKEKKKGERERGCSARDTTYNWLMHPLLGPENLTPLS
jgi:hypothetical protein